MSRAMKDSGVEWIGEIPENWRTPKFKNVATLYTGNSLNEYEKDTFEVDTDNSYPYISTKDIDLSSSGIDYENGLYITKSETKYKIADSESILICLEGGSAGKKIAYTNQPVAFVNKLCSIKSNKNNTKFMYYFMKSPAFTSQFNMNITGLIGGVSIGKVKELMMVLPSLEEQQKIANFLDEKTAHLDSIIANTTESIEAYKQYKQALITETVTKGLNKDARMKPSGIEWIGEIPERWDIVPLKRTASSIKGGIWGEDPKGDENDIGCIRVADFDRKRASIKERPYTLRNLPKDKQEGFLLEKGDLILEKSGGGDKTPVGQVVIYEKDYPMIYANFTARIKTNTDIADSYFMNYIHSVLYGLKITVRSIKQTTGIQNIDVTNYMMENIALPSLEEQQQIATFLDEKVGHIDSLIANKEKLVKELEAYKKTMIYEYVTGKKEVL